MNASSYNNCSGCILDRGFGQNTQHTYQEYCILLESQIQSCSCVLPMGEIRADNPLNFLLLGESFSCARYIFMLIYKYLY